MQRPIIALVALVFIFTSAPAAAENRWTDVGADPYKKSPELALKLLTAYGLNPAKTEEIAKAISQKKFVKGELKKGEKALVMVYGEGKVMKNPLMDWKGVNVLETEDYDAGEYIIQRAVICGNWLLTRRPAEISGRPEPKTAVVPKILVEVGPSQEEVGIIIYPWKSDSESKKLKKTDLSQSRDLRDSLKTAAVQNRAERFEKCVGTIDIAFHGILFELARGSGITVNQARSEFPQNFSEAENELKNIPVCKGFASVGFVLPKDKEKDWTTPRAWVKVTFRPKTDERGNPIYVVEYPDHQALFTCTGRGDDERRCGKKLIADVGELYRILHKKPDPRDPRTNWAEMSYRISER